MNTRHRSSLKSRRFLKALRASFGEHSFEGASFVSYDLAARTLLSPDLYPFCTGGKVVDGGLVFTLEMPIVGTIQESK